MDAATACGDHPARSRCARARPADLAREHGVRVTVFDQRGPTARPVDVIVLGMRRSGTSALTRLLSLCGASLPAGMLGSDATNPLGYREPRASLLLNGAILYRHGSAWFDPSLRVLEEGAFDAEVTAACMAEMEAFLEKTSSAPLVVINDLNIVVLSDMWFEAARAVGFDVAAVMAVRYPQDVIASLTAATGPQQN